MPRALTIACLLLVCSAAAARDLGDLEIPAERLPSWQPGVEGGIPDTSDWTVVDIKSVSGAKGDGVANDRAALQSAIDQAAPRTILLLPAGTFRTDGALRLKSDVVLRGQGPQRTRLLFRTGGRTGRWKRDFCDYGGLQLCGGPLGRERAITGGATRGSNTLTLEDASGLSVGDFLLVYLETNDKAYIERDKGRRYTSYIARIAEIRGPTVRLDRPLRQDLNMANGPRATRMEALSGAGVEDLKLEFTLDSEDKYQPLLRIERSVNSWVQNVEIYRGYRYSVLLTRSARNTIQASHMRSLIWFELQSTQPWNAYGVSFFEAAHDNLVTNNVFTDMYIQAMFSAGASGNVFSYNYVRSDQCHHGIFFHGQHPHSNLVEGNDSNCRVTLDNYWGRQGPWNTIFRNRIGDWSGSGMASKSIRTHADKPRIIAPYLNVIGNITRGFWQQPACQPPKCRDFDQWTPHLWGERNVYAEAFQARKPRPDTTYRQNAQGRRAPPSWRGFRMPASLYLDGRPDFWPAAKPWPAIGSDLDEFGSDSVVPLPAQDWYELRYPRGKAAAVPPPVLLEAPEQAYVLSPRTRERK